MTVPAADFHCLRERWRLQGTITTRTALRIGAAGQGLDAVDLPVIKDGLGFPVIPGASIKGALRATVEALVRGAAPDGAPGRIRACDPLSDGTSGEPAACGYRSRDDEPDAAATLGEHCTVCQLFGSHRLASHVRISDAMLERDPGRDPAMDRAPIELRDGVSIHRDLGRAKNTGKYDFEVVPPGTDFQLELFIENPRPWLAGLMLVGFDQIDEGFTALGGFTSRGLGRVTITWRSLAVTRAADLLAGRPAAIVRGDELPRTLDAWRADLGRYHAGKEGL